MFFVFATDHRYCILVGKKKVKDIYSIYQSCAFKSPPKTMIDVTVFVFLKTCSVSVLDIVTYFPCCFRGLYTRPRKVYVGYPDIFSWQ